MTMETETVEIEKSGMRSTGAKLRLIGGAGSSRKPGDSAIRRRTRRRRREEERVGEA